MKYEFIQEVYRKGKKRKNHTKSYKEEAVKLITNEGDSFAKAGRNLGVPPNLISRWKKELDGDGSEMAPEQRVAMRAELKELRKENKRLNIKKGGSPSSQSNQDRTSIR